MYEMRWQEASRLMKQKKEKRTCCWIWCKTLRIRWIRPCKYSKYWKKKLFASFCQCILRNTMHRMKLADIILNIQRSECETARPIDSSPAWCYGLRATCSYTRRTHTHTYTRSMWCEEWTAWWRLFHLAEIDRKHFSHMHTVTFVTTDHPIPRTPRTQMLMSQRESRVYICRVEATIFFLSFFLICALFIAIHCARIFHNFILSVEILFVSNSSFSSVYLFRQ